LMDDLIKQTYLFLQNELKITPINIEPAGYPTDIRLSESLFSLTSAFYDDNYKLITVDAYNKQKEYYNNNISKMNIKWDNKLKERLNKANKLQLGGSVYYQKYIKYKNKYVQLKSQQ
jgi:hypothetical protein